MTATIEGLESHLKKLSEKYTRQKTDFETQMQQNKEEKTDADDLRDNLKHSQTLHTKYEQKLQAKRELLNTYATKLKEVETQHMGCIEKQMNDRKEIDALQRVCTVETQKHLEKDQQARKLEWEKMQLEKKLGDLQF